MKKFTITVLSTLYLVLTPSTVRADHEVVVCPQPYGGGVVCGVKTHEPIKTGLVENLGLVGVASLGAALYFGKLAKKAKSFANSS